jgi:hypothetical protein
MALSREAGSIDPTINNAIDSKNISNTYGRIFWKADERKSLRVYNGIMQPPRKIHGDRHYSISGSGIQFHRYTANWNMWQVGHSQRNNAVWVWMLWIYLGNETEGPM